MSVLSRFFDTFFSAVQNAGRSTIPERCALIAAFAGTLAAAASYEVSPVTLFPLTIIFSGSTAVFAGALIALRKKPGFLVYVLLFLLLGSYALYRYTPGSFPYERHVRVVLRVTSYPVYRRNVFNFDARVIGIDNASRPTHKKAETRDEDDAASPGPGSLPNTGVHLLFRRRRPVTGRRVRVRTGTGLRVGRGDTLALDGFFSSIPDDGFGSYGRYLRSSGVEALFEGYSANASVEKRPAMFSPVLAARKLKNYIQYVNKCILPYPHSEFATALLTGDRSNLPGYMTDAFKKSGTMHILAVSGLHIGYLVIFVFFILRLFRLNRVVIYVLLGIFVLFFMIFVGERPSVRRAAVMTLCGILCYIFDRDKRYLNMLALAFFVLWLLDPRSIENPGFLLSFCAVFGILFIAGPLYGMLRKYMPRFLAGSLAASISVQVFIFPVMTGFFREFPFINIVANIPIVPLAGLSLALEVATLILYPLLLPAAILLAEVNTLVISSMFHSARVFALVPVVSIPRFPAGLIPVYLVVAAVCLAPLALRRKEDTSTPLK